MKMTTCAQAGAKGGKNRWRNSNSTARSEEMRRIALIRHAANKQKSQVKK